MSIALESKLQSNPSVHSTLTLILVCNFIPLSNSTIVTYVNLHQRKAMDKEWFQFKANLVGLSFTVKKNVVSKIVRTCFLIPY